MKRQSATIILALGAGCILGGFPPDAQPGGGSVSYSLEHGGITRTYRIYLPVSYDKTKQYPLVLALHGGGGTGKRMEDLTRNGFNALAERERFVVAYPDGVDRHWNDGRGLDRWRAQQEDIDDVGFLSHLIDTLVGELRLDPKRVYVTGASNGALMAHRLACERPEMLAAIAPVIGAMPANIAPRCAPSRPVPVLMINGTEDTLVPWEGGEIRLGRTKLGEKLSVPDTVRLWVKLNGCPSKPTVTYEPDKDPQDGTRVRKENYGPCRNDSEIILYAVEGGGHTWPGGLQYFPERIVGKTSRDIDASEVIWRFFQQHRLK
ncbi:MAG: phospholipase [Nitrospirae bacterium]|nr:phospholipase [Nitrospirota bacterium]